MLVNSASALDRIGLGIVVWSVRDRAFMAAVKPNICLLLNARLSFPCRPSLALVPSSLLLRSAFPYWAFLLPAASVLSPPCQN